MDPIILTALCSVGSSVVSSVVSFFVAKKKYNVEVDHVAIKNMEESLAFYERLADSNQKILAEILTKSEELANSNIQLLMEVQNLKVQVGTLLQIINTELSDVDFSKYGIEVQNGTIIRKKTDKKDK
jgi:hypothetical protein